MTVKERAGVSIAVELILVISTLLILSLGGVILWVEHLVRQDVAQRIQGNSAGVSVINARLAESLFKGVKDSTLSLFDDRAYTQSSDTQTIAYFWEKNPAIAAIVGNSGTLINGAFFVDEEIQPSLVESSVNAPDSFLLEAKNLARQGKPVVLNVCPAFQGVPLLLLVLAASDTPVSPDNLFMIFFSSESLMESFGSDAYTSFMVNAAGNVLISPNYDNMKTTTSLLNDTFVKKAIESETGTREEVYFAPDGIEYFASSCRLEGGFGPLVCTVVPTKVAFEGITTTTRRNIYLAQAVLALGVLFAWFFSRALRRPILTLREAATSIENGEYRINLNIPARDDEVGLLSASVIDMSHALSTFEKFTNKHIALLARQGTLPLGGAEREAVIFLSDIRAFTAMSEAMTPEEVLDMLNQYMEKMVACVHLTGGTVDKFIGDAILAHWGAVETRGSAEEDALGGISAALMMRACLAALNAKRRIQNKEPIKIGMALNRGIVVSGQIGTEERLVFTVIGETVSFTERMESLNKPLGTEILISEAVWQNIGKILITEEMPAVLEKGKRTRLFAVVNVRDQALAEKLLADLAKMPQAMPEIYGQYIGHKGPKTLGELRALLSIPVPNLRQVNMNEEEKKFRASSPETTGGAA
jgi:adenylate cyclase